MKSMKSLRACAWAACCVAISALPALAQDGASSSQSGRRPVEISIGGTGVVTWITSGGDLRTTVSFPVNERISIEVFGGPYRGTGNSDLSPNIRAFYGGQVKREIDRGRRAGVTPFLTFGLTGVVSRDVTHTCSYVNTGTRVVATCLPHEKTQVLPPMIGLFGGGVQYTLAPHLAVRVEAQGVLAVIIPAGVRVSVGLSIPVGHQFSSRRTERSR